MKKLTFGLISILICMNFLISGGSCGNSTLAVTISNYNSEYVFFKVEGGSGTMVYIAAFSSPISDFNNTLKMPYKYSTIPHHDWNTTQFGEYKPGIYVIFNYYREIPEFWSQVYLAAINVDAFNNTIQIVPIHNEFNPSYIPPIIESESSTSYNSEPNSSTINQNGTPRILSEFEKLFFGLLIIAGIFSCFMISIRYRKNLSIHSKNNLANKFLPTPPNSNPNSKKKWSWRKDHHMDKIRDRLKERFPNTK